jgi:protein-S-isoprenylcysteine O-methyltransferase Ste14
MGMTGPPRLGILPADIGFVGVLRSVLAVAALPVVFGTFKRRMEVEEAFLAGRFGAESRDYVTRTRRLLPRAC